jgi:hypothetical protein
MAENKTKPTDASVEDYIASRANEEQRPDCKALMSIFKRITKQQPKMWSPSIVGYGSYRYTYESGRTGEMRQYSVNGERRSFALLRPIDDVAAQARIRDLILEAYSELEASAT